MLPFLSPVIPKLPDRVPFYDPHYLCKVSTYMEIANKHGVQISLQALYGRVERGSIPHVKIDGIPFILLSVPMKQLLECEVAIEINPIHKTEGVVVVAYLQPFDPTHRSAVYNPFKIT